MRLNDSNLEFSISDTAANIVAATAAAVNEAEDITVTDTATVAQATTIEARTNDGSNTWQRSLWICHGQRDS